MRESIPVVVATSRHPHHLYRVLLQVVQMAGGGQTPLYIQLEGDCPPTEQLAQLFGIPYSKVGARNKSDGSLSSATQAIADVTFAAVNSTFTHYTSATKVVFMEDDVILSPDFLWFFQQTSWLLDEDPTVLAVSAHHTYSVPGRGFHPARLLRGHMPPQWGWLVTRMILQAWVPSQWGDWDYWVSAWGRERGLSVVFPEVSRSLHAGSQGTHIDGFQQSMFFSRHAAHLPPPLPPLASSSSPPADGSRPSPLTNLIDLHSIVKEQYSARLKQKMARATPLILTSLDHCGPNLVPEGQDGPFVLFFGDKREQYAILQCLELFAEDLRCDYEGVQQVRVGGHMLYLAYCPASPHCTNLPPGYIAVPHDDQLMEAISALDLFRRSLHLRSPFRLRVATDSPAEEATLRNSVLGYAVLGMDVPSLYLNKGVILPSLDGSEGLKQSIHRVEEIVHNTNGPKQSIHRLEESIRNTTGALRKSVHGLNKGIHSHINYSHTSSNMINQTSSKPQSVEVYPSHLYSNTVSPLSAPSRFSQYTNHSSLHSPPYLRDVSPWSTHKPTSSHYYLTCMTKTCVVADPFLALDQTLPQHLQAAARKALTEAASSSESNQHKDDQVFTVEDFFNNPNLFKRYYGGR
ncbi:hypothetical protein Pcinc_022672 [Petrolisthes cinctipes]|uniref:Alpha-1,3-mannosyl-glycoprotein 2-beta-N-acetylglucosaminyltransferase n=1 Tax=Petrolisthes cinctipes TaxID=88211 RepID=A0AAE1FEM0_PETCI|nr:hypothetical protein Pcinc_022672 [Petrolisthes cinctipes]